MPAKSRKPASKPASRKAKPGAKPEAKRRSRKLPPEPLTAYEVRALLNACSNRAPTGIRNKALLVLLYRAGLRLSEALSLLPKDLDREAGVVRVLHGKGDKARVVGLDAGAWAVLERWLDRRKVLGFNGREPVFCTLKGGAIHTAYIRTLMPRLAIKAGINKRVHAHGLRHTHAFELANEGTPLHVIQQQLGHTSLAVTSRYVSHLAPGEVIAKMRGREWSL